MTATQVLADYTFIDKEEEMSRYSHSAVIWAIGRIIGNFVIQNRLGIMLSDPDIYFPTSGKRLRPDLIFISDSKKTTEISESYHGVPDIIFEVMSPASMLEDAQMKKLFYALEGVPEYWIIFPELYTVYVFQLEDGAYRLHQVAVEKGTLTSTVLKGMEINLEEVFVY